MVLMLEALGPEYAGFTPDDAGNGIQTYDQRKEDGLDPQGDETDLRIFEWQETYDADFVDAAAVDARAGTFSAGSDVDVFREVDDARGYFADSRGEVDGLVGRSGGGLTVSGAEQFDAAAGDEAFGVVQTATVEGLPNVWVIGVQFRYGRLVASCGVAGFGDLTQEVKDAVIAQVRELAPVLETRIREVLAGTPTATPAPAATPEGATPAPS